MKHNALSMEAHPWLPAEARLERVVEARALASGEVRALVACANTLTLLDAITGRAVWRWIVRPEGCLVATPGPDVGDLSRAMQVALPGADCNLRLDQILALAPHFPAEGYTVAPYWHGACLTGPDTAVARLVELGKSRRFEQVLRLGPGAAVEVLVRDEPVNGYAGSRCAAPVAVDEREQRLLLSSGATVRVADAAPVGRVPAPAPGLGLLQASLIVLVPRDRTNRAEVFTVDGAPVASTGGHRSPVVALALAPDGRQLVTAERAGWVRAWDLSPPQSAAPVTRTEPAELACALRARVIGDDVSALAALDRGTVVVGHRDGRIGLLSSADEAAVEHEVGRAPGPVAGIAVSPDGNTAFVWTTASANVTRAALPEELGRTAR